MTGFLTWAGGSDTTVQSREALDLWDTESTLAEDWASVGGQACVAQILLSQQNKWFHVQK